jgi:hypothetical protein
VLDRLGNPGRIGDIGRTPGDVVHVGRVEQPALHLVLEQVPDRLPVAPGRLHPDWGHPVAGQPLGQHIRPAVVVVNRRVSAWRPPWPSGTRTHAVTEPLCTSRPAQRSTSVSISSPPPGTPASGRHPEEPLPGESQSRARGNSAGCPRPHVRLISGLAAPSSTNVGRMTSPFLIRRGWPSTAIRGLSEIDGPAPCYSAFPRVVLLHQSYKNGVNYGPRPPTARLQATATTTATIQSLVACPPRSASAGAWC